MREPVSIDAWAALHSSTRASSAMLWSDRPRDLQDMTGPQEGPRATLEVLQSMHGLGVTPTTYHGLWQQRSGVQSEAAVCWEHKLLCQTLGLALQYDHLDVTNVAFLELVTRRFVMIERAVKLNPKAPSLAVPLRMIHHALSQGRG